MTPREWLHRQSQCVREDDLRYLLDALVSNIDDATIVAAFEHDPMFYGVDKGPYLDDVRAEQTKQECLCVLQPLDFEGMLDDLKRVACALGAAKKLAEVM